jgi:hypothetical protein
MISNDAIHVQVEEGGKDVNVEGIGTQKLMIPYVWCMMCGEMLNLQMGQGICGCCQGFLHNNNFFFIFSPAIAMCKYPSLY